MLEGISLKPEFRKDILSVRNLSKYYIVKKSNFTRPILIKAVNDVSFDIAEGETLGLIGESGSGKSTIGSLVVNLIKSNSGKVIFDGKDIFNLESGQMRRLRKDMQIIFQHTQEVLDPKMTIEELIAEPLKLYSILKEDSFSLEISRLLDMVGLGEKEKSKFTYQLSGGQKQRVGIARAIAARPKFIVCDEPVSALDVSVQGQILNLLIDLKKEMNLTYLFISHDLNIVSHISDRIAVMKNGKIIEIGDSEKVINNPDNDYTKKLMDSRLL